MLLDPLHLDLDMPLLARYLILETQGPVYGTTAKGGAYQCRERYRESTVAERMTVTTTTTL
jgi:hypothetical protein